MFSRAAKIFVLILLNFHLVVASSGDDSAKSANSDEKKVDGSEPSDATKAPPKEKSKYESYSSVALRVNTLYARIKASEDELKRLISEKKETKDEKRVTEIVQQMIKVHKELQENAKEYTQQKALLNYSYPEKGQHEKRKYERIEVKSIEEMEGQFNLTTGIKRTIDKARMQYSDKEDRDRHQKNTNADPKNNRNQETIAPSLLEPVILKK